MATDPEYLDPNEEREAELVEAPPSTLAILNQSEYAAMVATANLKGNKRNIEEFSKKLMTYATYSAPVAITMFYSLPRANKQIIGPSVRYAEIVAPCWKNNSSGSRLIGEADKTVTAQGVFLDYENNIRNVKEIPRRITSSDGRRFNDDMIMTTAKAALSIAYREAILKGGVPQALWTPAYEEAKMTAVGKAMSHSQRIDAAMDYLTKLGVTEWQICNAVGVPSPKEMGVDEIVTLRTLCEEIKQQRRTIEDVFGSPHDKEIDALFVQLKKNAAEQNLLRTSYRGRAGQLLEYLRSQAGSASKSSAPQAEQKTETKTAQAQPQTEQAESANGGKAGKKKASKDTDKPADVQPEQQQDQKAQDKPAVESKDEPQAGSFNF